MVELLHKHVEIYLEMKIVQEYETDFQGSYWEMAMIRSRDFLESKF